MKGEKGAIFVLVAASLAPALVNAQTPPAPQALKITVLGTGSPRPLMTRFGPSVLIEAGGQKLLIDCGRGAPQRLWQLDIPLRDVSTVFLTHLHSDHMMGVADLWLTGWLATPFGRRTEPIRIYGPAGTREAMSNLEKAFQVDIRSRLEDEKLPPRGISLVASDVAEGTVYEHNGMKITAFDVDHGEAIRPALGYRIDYAGRSAVISGDTRFSENLIKFAKGADVVVHEVAAASDELLRTDEASGRILSNHTTPQQAGILFDRVKPRLAVYTHIILLGPAATAVTLQDLVSMTRQTYSGPLEVGEDLLAIVIGDRIEINRPASSGR
jgi:ribonuclease Z